MRKLIGLNIFLLFFLFTLTCCKKQNQDIVEANGQLKYGGSIAADGVGYYIELYPWQVATSTGVVPENLPDSLQKPTIDIPVKIKFYYTGQGVQRGMIADYTWPVIHLTDIQRR